METLPLKTVRVRCHDAQQFQDTFAAKVSARGVFVPSDAPEPIGTRVRFRMEFIRTTEFVSGIAVVVKHGRKERQLGVFLQFEQLDPESIQFALGPLLLKAPGPLPREVPEDAPADGPFDPNRPPPIAPLRSGSGELPATAVARAPAEPQLGEPPQPPTRVHSYRAGELQRAKEPERWAGGLVPFERVGDYQLLERLGLGDAAEVYAARRILNNGADQLVALKLVLPEITSDEDFGRLFLNEVRVAATLEHPNVVTVWDAGEEVGRPFLAMEYIRGRPLGRLLQALRRRGHRPDVAMAVHVALQLCRALEYLHGKKDLDGTPLKLVHREVNPGNLLLSRHGVVKLVDLGVATTEVGFDASDDPFGKHAHMAPEQVQGGPPSPAWDLYATGFILYELLTLEGLVEQHAPSAKNSQVPLELDRIVLWATESDPARRAPSAKQLRARLEEVARKLAPFDMQALMEDLFGPELQEEERRLEGLMLTARARTAAPSARVTPWSSLGTRARRFVAASALGRFTQRRRGLALGAVALLAGVLGTGGLLVHRARAADRALTLALRAFDESVAAARLIGPSDHDAADHLRSAAKLAPADPRVAIRRQLLANLFEELATAAEAREDVAEAMAHLRAALEVDPSRAGLEDRLRGAEQQMRGRAQRTEVRP